MRRLTLGPAAAFLAFLVGIIADSGVSALLTHPADSESDRRHKLYEAMESAHGWHRDEVLRELGLSGDPFTDPAFRSFIAEHNAWAVRNNDFCRSLSRDENFSAERAREYVRQHSSCCRQ